MAKSQKPIGIASHEEYDLSLLGGWTNPFEEYARQSGSFPYKWNHHLVSELEGILDTCTYTALNY